MLRITPIAHAGAAKSYFARADYYIDGREPDADWHGRAAARLGLAGRVDKRAFDALCDNRHPARGHTLTAARGPRRVGYDFTFSVPKSVSVLHALGGDGRIAPALRAAVAGTMAEVEREMAARVRRGGADHDRTTGNMVWCDVLHHTGRPVGGHPDPHLHVHAVAFSLTWDGAEGQWKAGQFGDLKADGPYFQALFRARLATELQRLGYRLDARGGDFEVVGVPARVRQEFSRRTARIDQLADQLGVTRAATKAKLGATSREAKGEGQAWEALLSHWADRLSDAELRAVRDTVAGAEGPSAPEERNAAAVDFAVAHLTERRSVVDQRQVMTEALRHGLGSVTPEGIARELSRPGLIRREAGGRTLVTTQEVLAEEKRLLAFAREGRGRCKPLATPGAAGAVSPGLAGAPAAGPPAPGSPGVEPSLSPSQRAAVEHVLTSPDRLVLVRGAAGVGKTTLTRSLLARVPVPWTILAPSADASRGVLRAEGFAAADTLAAFLSDDRMQHSVKGGLIVLDEAGMAPIRDVVELTRLAGSLNARVLLLGDRKQLKAVTRGDVLALLEDKAGLPVAEVGEIRRQAGAYRTATQLLSEGRVTAGFDTLAGLGWVKEVDRPGVGGRAAAPRPDPLVADYLAAAAAGRSVLVVAPTHAEGDRITDDLRARLRQVGTLHGEERVFPRLVPLHLTAAERGHVAGLPDGTVAQFVPGTRTHRAGARVPAARLAAGAPTPAAWAAYRPDTIRLAAGDSVRTTAAVTDTAGRRIDGGSALTVTGFTPRGEIRTRTAAGLDRVLPADVGHLRHGYVVTAYAAQGKTCDEVLVAMPAATFGAVGREAFYVAVSRGRRKATVYTDDARELRAQVARADVRLHATDLVRRPPDRVRKGLRNYLSFLHKAVSIGRDVVRGHHRELDYARG